MAHKLKSIDNPKIMREKAVIAPAQGRSLARFLHKIWATVFLFFLAIPLGVMIAGILWILQTQQGTHFAFQALQHFLPMLTIAKVDGTLGNQLVVSDITIALPEDYWIRIDHVDLNGLKINPLRWKVQLDTLHIGHFALSKDWPSDDLPVNLPGIPCPVLFEVKKVQMDHFAEIRSHRERTTLTQIVAQLRWSGVRLELHNATLKLFHHDIDQAEGTIDFSGQYPVTIQGLLSYHIEDFPPLQIKTRFRGALGEEIFIQGEMLQPTSATATITLYDLFTHFHWDGNLFLGQTNLHDLEDSWPLATIAGPLALDGNSDIVHFSSDHFSVISPETTPFKVSFSTTRQIGGFWQFDRLFIYPLQGRQSPPTSFNLLGQIDEEGVFDFSAEWRQVKSTLPFSQVAYRSPKGGGIFRGDKNRYEIEAVSEVAIQDYPSSVWSLVGQSGHRQLQIEKLSGQLLDGEIHVNGNLSWQSGLAWHLGLSGRKVNPGKYWPQWPGQLAWHLDSQGSYLNHQLETDIQIAELAGTLRHYPIGLQGQLGYHQDQLTLQKAKLVSGKAQLNAEGSVGKNWNLQWSADIADFRHLLPQIQGKFKTQGKITGTREAPMIIADLQMPLLDWDSYKARNLIGSIRVDWSDQRPSQLDVKADSLQMASFLSLNQIKLQGKGKVQQQVIISAQGIWNQDPIVLNTEGRWNKDRWQGKISRLDIGIPNLGRWKIDHPVDLVLGDHIIALNYTCLQPLDPLKKMPRWSQTLTYPQICLQAETNHAVQKAKLKLSQLAITPFSSYLKPGLRWDGFGDAELTVTKDRGNTTGDLALALSSGAFHYPIAGRVMTIPYQSGELKASLAKEQLVSQAQLFFHTEAKQKDSDYLSTQISISNIFKTSWQKWLVEGHLQSKLRNLNPVTVFLPETVASSIDRMRGELVANLGIQGTLGTPKVTGYAKLTEAAVEISSLGLLLKSINLTASTNETGALAITGQGRSGEGIFQTSGTWEVNKVGQPLTLRMTGKHFMVANIPEAKIWVNPDLKLTVAEKNINLSGKLEIPSAKLEPRDILGKVNSSKDVVIVDKPEEKPSTLASAFSSRVRMVLGDRVYFKGFGVQCRLTGDVLTQNEPNLPTTGIGEIKIHEGRYKVYGQTVKATRGRLLFVGGPMDNPMLDVEAIRETNHQDVVAGVQVHGTVEQPQLKLFSNPPMSQQDTLSYLLLGHTNSISNSNALQNSKQEEALSNTAQSLGISGGNLLLGQLGSKLGQDISLTGSSPTDTALVVGRYLSPSLYLSYGVGLLQTGNTLGLRYRLSRRWQVEATGSGGQQQNGAGQKNGVDLTYSIEHE